jgi:hypothetical protein
MSKRMKLLVIAVSAGALLAIGGGVGIAARGDDDRPLKGTNYDRATSAALDYVGGGTVTGTEVGDAREGKSEAGDDAEAYEVDVRRDDGRQVEVELDSSFTVTGSEADDVGEGSDVEED